MKKIQYLNILRVISMLFVILLHCIKDYIVSVGLFNTKTWWACNVVNSLVRSGVPLFFMISGFLLLSSEKTANFAVFYKKRLVRVLIPFFCWNIIYFVYYSFANGEGIDLVKFFRELVYNGSAYHFWFVYTMVGIYLLMPFLKRIVDNCSTKQLIWFFVLAIFAGTIRPFINICLGTDIYIFNVLLDGYIGYFLLGYILGKIDLSKRTKTLAYIGGIAGMFIGVAGNFLFSSKDGLNLLFNGGYMINHFLCAAAIFVFFKGRKPIENIKISNFIEKVSTLTFAVYLMHVLVLDVLQWYYADFVPYVDIAVKFLVTSAISFLIAYIISKIKGVNKILI